MLSDAKIRSLKPKEKAYKVYDDRGLYMAVNPNGSRWWRFKYKFDSVSSRLQVESVVPWSAAPLARSLVGRSMPI